MIFKPRKNEKLLSIYLKDVLLFKGTMSQLPLRENIILEKSILFFNDPDPCLIHRNAVQIRLLSEIEQQLSGTGSSIEQCPLLQSYADFNSFDRITFNFTE